MTPSRAAKYADLETAISAWDKEKAYFEQLCPTDALGPELERVCLIKICPLELAKHLQKEAKRFEKPEQVREEISDWVARDDRNRAGGLLAGLDAKVEEPVAEEEEVDEEYQDEVRQTVGEEMFAVMVKKGLMKTRKGKGKGKAPRTCHKCGSEEHFIAQCPKASPEEKQASAEKGLAKAKGKAATKAAGNKGQPGAKGGWNPTPRSSRAPARASAQSS